MEQKAYDLLCNRDDIAEAVEPGYCHKPMYEGLECLGKG